MYLYLFLLCFVHNPFSSGGCGRTGTFIAVSILLERLKTEGVVDVFHTVRGIRLQRPGMVRNEVSLLVVNIRPFYFTLYLFFCRNNMNSATGLSWSTLTLLSCMLTLSNWNKFIIKLYH